MRQCEGRNVSGIRADKLTYRTPPTWRVCANFRPDGPTPCWFPNCVHAIEQPKRSRWVGIGIGAGIGAAIVGWALIIARLLWAIYGPRP